MSNTPDRLTAAYNQVKKDLRMITSPKTWQNMTQNQIIGGLTIALLMVGVITGVYLGQQSQENRQQAFGSAPTGTCGTGPYPDPSQCFDNIVYACINDRWQNTGNACQCTSNAECSTTCQNGTCDQFHCDSCVPASSTCPGGQHEDNTHQCAIGNLPGVCCVGDAPSPTPACNFCISSPQVECNGDIIFDPNICPSTPFCQCPGGTTPSKTPTATPGTGGGPTPTTPPGATNTPPNNPTPTNPPSTPIPTPPDGKSQANIRVCKAISVNGQILDDWSSIPETRFQVTFEKNPPLQDLDGEKNVPSGYGTKEVDTIRFKTSDPGNLQYRPNLGLAAACQDLAVNYNDGDREDITYRPETIETANPNGGWTPASGWNDPKYNDSVLIKDINGNPNANTVDPGTRDPYDGALFDGQNNTPEDINRVKYADGYIRVNDNNHNLTLLIVNEYSQQVSTPTNTPGNGPVCLNVTLNDLTNPDPNTPPLVGDNVTLTCAEVAGAQRYEFAMKQPDNTWVSIAQSSSVVNVSQVFAITMSGHYVVQCRPCTGLSSATCSDWEVPLN